MLGRINLTENGHVDILGFEKIETEYSTPGVLTPTAFIVLINKNQDGRDVQTKVFINKNADGSYSVKIPNGTSLHQQTINEVELVMHSFIIGLTCGIDHAHFTFIEILEKIVDMTKSHGAYPLLQAGLRKQMKEARFIKK